MRLSFAQNRIAEPSCVAGPEHAKQWLVLCQDEPFANPFCDARTRVNLLLRLNLNYVDDIAIGINVHDKRDVLVRLALRCVWAIDPRLFVSLVVGEAFAIVPDSARHVPAPSGTAPV